MGLQKFEFYNESIFGSILLKDDPKEKPHGLNKGVKILKLLICSAWYWSRILDSLTLYWTNTDKFATVCLPGMSAKVSETILISPY